jgi:CDP-diacylglycerol---glycerol-3-phosphate 3-phosphatidyltransferase
MVLSRIRMLTIPDKLTILRIIIVPFFLLFMFSGGMYSRILALVLFVIAALTDAFDGAIARRMNIVSRFGTFLDPLADKLLVSAALVSFVQFRELNIPAWMVVFIISREFIITGLRLLAMSHNRVISASRSGKFKMTSQTIVIITILVILVTLSAIRRYSGLVPAQLLEMSGWRYAAGIFLFKVPYWIMLAVTVLTVYSGVSYIRKNLDVIKLEFDSR